MSRGLGVLLALVLTSGAAAGASPEVTIQVVPRAAQAGQSAVVTGTIASGRAGEEVHVEQNPCGLGWGYLPPIRTETTVGGGYSLALESHTAPTANTTLRTRWRGVRSPSVRIFVQPWISLRRFWGKLRVEILGPFAPQLVARGRYAVIEGRRPGGLWRPVGRVELRLPSSSYREVVVGTFAVNLSRYAFVRAALPASEAKPCFLAAKSTPIRP